MAQKSPTRESAAIKKSEWTYAGCVTVVLALAGFFAYRFGLNILVVIGFVVAVLLLANLSRAGLERYYLWRFRRRHPGKDLLLVYTDSASWKDRIEQQWLPLWRDRAVILNRSRPWWRWQLEARVWGLLSDETDHTPVAIHIPATGIGTIVPFHDAFREHQNGRPDHLLASEKALADLLGTPTPGAT